MRINRCSINTGGGDRCLAVLLFSCHIKQIKQCLYALAGGEISYKPGISAHAEEIASCGSFPYEPIGAFTCRLQVFLITQYAVSYYQSVKRRTQIFQVFKQGF